jgi:DNA-binding MurR/RpiR family transcriptional regulator
MPQRRRNSEDPATSVYERIAAAYPKLSEAPKQFADFVVTHPVEAARKSIQMASLEAGVSVASANRFARALGYVGYGEFRAELIRSFQRAYEPVQLLKNRQSEVAASVDVFAASLTQDIQNIQATRDHLPSDACARAVEMTISAKRRFVIGFFHAAHLAALLASNLDLRCGDTRAVTNSDGAVGAAAQLFKYTRDDLVIAIAFPRYFRETIELCRIVKSRGVPVLAITDGPRSPLASIADVALYAHAQSTIAPTSDASALAMVEALSAAVAHRAQNAVRSYEAFTAFALPWLDPSLPERSGKHHTTKKR